MPEEISEILVGIDVGGTKTQVRAEFGGQALADRVFPSAGWQPADPAVAAAFLVDLIDDTLPPERVPGVVAVGAHGCDSDPACAAVQAELESRLSVPCLVRNDAELLVPAVGLDDGIGLVAGTGSIAIGRDGDDNAVYVGGWGWLFGDEGSAPGLVREAVRAVLRARDRGESPDLLAQLLVREYGVTEVIELTEALAAESGARDWGQRAALVFDALTGGSSLAESVITDGAESLAGLVVRAVERGVVGRDVVVAGGVILNQPPLRQAFERALAEALPETVVHALDVDPVHGAIHLAARLAKTRAAA